MTGMVDPLDLLERWCGLARECGVPLHDAVCLATCTKQGRPSARMVLFRGTDRGRLLFYSDYRSRKAGELESNPHAALVFYWKELARQIRVEGGVERAERELSDRYFLGRPRGSRISAWASHQSRPVGGREELERRREQVERRFAGAEVVRPEFWGGYVLLPESIEFWQERPDRFHDRTLYRRDGGTWGAVRLQP